MIPPLNAIKRILWGNVRYKDKLVPVIKRSYPYDKTPCITIDDSGGSSFGERFILNEYYPVDSSHPQYDKDNPFRKIPQQVIREYYNTTLNINIWCNNEDEREALSNTVQDLFYKAQSDHYLFCNNYHDGECSYLGTGCYGEHFDTNNRGVKHQCTNPLVYGYENIFTTYNLIRSSFHLDPPFTLDDNSKTEPVLRSVLRLHTGFYTDHIIGGLVSENISQEDYIV